MTFQVNLMGPRTLSWWRDEKDDIDMQPVYQRKGRIWSVTQKQYLIDSLLNGFDVPKLYFADFTILNGPLNPTGKKYAVIDGKQRLEAIYGFFDDEFTLPKGFQYVDDAKLELGGLNYSDLMKNYAKVARKLDNAPLTIMGVVTDDESKINELFIRLNSSKPLTGAELRNAMLGKLPRLIREISDHPFFTNRIAFNVTRSQDKNTAAKLLLLEHRGTIVDTKKAQLDALVKEAQESDTEDQLAQDASELEEILVDTAVDAENDDIDRSAKQVHSVLDKLSAIFSTTDPLLKQQAQIVVIYWMVRELEEGQALKMRPFLVRFDEARQNNRGAPPEKKDAELSEFELMARTSNDAYSIRRRVQIMTQRLISFVP